MVVRNDAERARRVEPIGVCLVKGAVPHRLGESIGPFIETSGADLTQQASPRRGSAAFLNPKVELDESAASPFMAAQIDGIDAR